MNVKFFLIIFTATVILGLFLNYSTFAQNGNISFPVAELGNCKDKADCKSYCDKPENISACIDFAEKNNLMPQIEIQKAKKISKIAELGGPGNCKSQNECKNYCDDITHIEECLDFAEKHDIIPAEELKEAKQVLKALRSGAKMPGDCKNKNVCDAYCKEANHMEECITFAEAAGLIPDNELQEAKQALAAVKKGIKPPACRGKKQCDEYCALPENFEECLNFAEAAGFISTEEAKMARQTGGKGPAGCASKESCDEFCNKPENSDVCFNFAKEHGLIPEEKLKEMQEGMERLKTGVSQMPEETVSCLKDKLGADIIERIETGAFTPSSQTGEFIKACIDQFESEMQLKIHKELEQAPPEIIECLKKEIGEQKLNEIENGEALTPDIGDKMRNCFEGMRQQMLEKSKEQMKSGMEEATPEIKICMELKLGKELFDKIISGDVEGLTSEDGDKIKNASTECVQESKPKMPQIPKEATDCLEEIYGADFMQKIEHGQIQPPDNMQQQIEECVKRKMPAPQIDCAVFQNVPQCSYVPDAAGRDACKKCFPEK